MADEGFAAGDPIEAIGRASAVADGWRDGAVAEARRAGRGSVMLPVGEVERVIAGLAAIVGMSSRDEGGKEALAFLDAWIGERERAAAPVMLTAAHGRSLALGLRSALAAAGLGGRPGGSAPEGSRDA